MPRKPIDYSKTYIYKLVCKDPTIPDSYVGHTTKPPTRKNKHKSACNNPNATTYNLYVYQFIRDHGGWDNWEMIIIECICCVDAHEARRNERIWFDRLGATLNGIRPCVTIDERIENNRELSKQYRETNRDAITEQKKQYYDTNKEVIKAKQKQYRETNRDELNAKHNQYYITNLDAIKAKHKQYRETNRDELNAKHKQYRETNRDELNAKHKQYRETNKESINARRRELYALKKLGATEL
jgi:hypothetical protein